MSDTLIDHIEIVEGPGGPRPRIRGHRIRVQDVAVWAVKMGMSPDEIVDEFPTITLADVHAALAYYWDHREEIERTIEEEQTFVEELRGNMGSRLVEKLQHRQSQ